MSFFLKKQQVSLEDFCRGFYDKLILNPIVGKVDVSNVYPDYVKKSIAEVYPRFANLAPEKLKEELIALQFELFALAWIHKFVSGKTVVAQSAFTKRYLHETGRDDIWNRMEHYNEFIGMASLNWLTSLGKMNLSFWHNMKKDLTTKNIEEAKEIGISQDESIDRVNNRLCSETAWRKRIVLGFLVLALCDGLDLNSNELNEEVGFRLAVFIRGLYDGAWQLFKEVKIIS